MLLLISKLLYPKIYYSLINKGEGEYSVFSVVLARILGLAFLASLIVGGIYQSQLWLSLSLFIGLTSLPMAIISLAGYEVRLNPSMKSDRELIAPILNKQVLNWAILQPFAIYLSQLNNGLLFLASGFFFAMLYNVMSIYKLKSFLDN